ncbi:UNVERIFIED_CONTAM: Retrovirus-related Pol polyprotein from transposon TNT 1-94 [Sesamum calycinum]|uniref:Retrovirus-related Pol polyprotein from transposon TNT 1-94 n=1 Tax=Sesamum calycinum TaxID=2727403 RepID=A0AAW2SFN4_9LAMI
MTNDIQKQYDRLENVPSTMLYMREVYAVPDRHTRYVATKAFFGTRIAEGLSVQSHGFKMLSLVEKLKDIKAGLNNDTYIDVILQSLPPSYDPFIINYNMKGLEKSIHELINMLVQYEATTHKSAQAVLIGEASTFKAKDKRARRWKRKKGKGKITTATASAEGALAAAGGKGKGKGKVGSSQRSKANDVRMHCQGKGHWKRECPQLLSNPGMLVIEVNIITNVASWVLDTGCGAHICYNLHVLDRSRKLSKDEMILRLGDGKTVAVEAVGSLNLVISDHIRIELKDCYYVSNMIKNIIPIIVLDNNSYAFKINKNDFYLMIDDNYHLLGTNLRPLEGSRNTDLKLRIKLAITSKPFSRTEEMDVKTAFLNDYVEEEIFMDQLEDFNSIGEEQKVCRLQRSIYDLKQVFQSWNTRFDEVKRGYNFIKNEHDPCVYKKISGSSVAYLVLYVDYILLIGYDVKMLGYIKAWLSTQFFMKDMGEASYILGIEIYRDRSRRMLGLNQSLYIEKVLKRFKMKTQNEDTVQ